MTDEAPAPTFEFIGGHVALDLLNTVEWRLDAAQRTDDFTGYAHVLAWAEQAGLMKPPEPSRSMMFIVTFSATESCGTMPRPCRSRLRRLLVRTGSTRRA